MNDNLTKFIDVIKDYKLKKLGANKTRFKRETDPEKLTLAKDQELVNNEKAILNLNIEHSKLQDRCAVVADPARAFGYMVDMRQRLDDTNSEIAKLKK